MPGPSAAPQLFKLALMGHALILALFVKLLARGSLALLAAYAYDDLQTYRARGANLVLTIRAGDSRRGSGGGAAGGSTRDGKRAELELRMTAGGESASLVARKMDQFLREIRPHKMFARSLTHAYSVGGGMKADDGHAADGHSH